MKKIGVIMILCAVMVFAGAGCKGPKSNYKVKLDVWGTFDNTNVYNDSFAEYQNINENIESIIYHKNTLESYKEDLLSALAAGNGPDIFMIHNSWIPDFQDKIEPVPEYMMTEQEFRDTFVDVVADDFVIDGQIYGVPLSVDSLALYYNKDIFNAAGLTRPPKTWKEFNEDVKILTKVDEFGNIKQAGAAIGTADVNRSMDILTVMMLQDGVDMSNRVNKQITFSGVVGSGSYVPSERALKQYTNFASAASPVYTWNKNQNYSIDEFFQGNVAMMINYSWHYDTIKAKNAKLNFAVADLPQKSFDNVGEQTNFANYWSFVVAKNKQPTQSLEEGVIQVTNEMRVHEAWQFLKALSFPITKGIILQNAVNGERLTYNPTFDLTQKYLEKTGKPAARRDLIEKEKADVRLGAFARGNLIARSWWRNNSTAVDAIFADMIDSVNTGKASVHDAIELGAQRAQQLVK